MSAAPDKQALRAEFRRRRRTLPEAVRASETALTVQRCLELIARRGAGPVASYLAHDGELDLDALHRHLWGTGQVVHVPRVRAPGELAWHAIQAEDRLVAGAYGIREANAAGTPETTLPGDVLLLVPGLAFAHNGERLGQGGGFYDRLLARQGVVAVGVGFSCQRCDALPMEAHDRLVDGLILGGVLVRDPGARLQP
jgi:5-formyltetrahydrofolate cyclo-ligase